MCLNLIINLSFKIILSSKYNLFYRPPFNFIIISLIIVKESTINNLVIIKDNIVKHFYFNNKASNTYYNSENI